MENQGVVEFLDGVSTFNSQASYSGSMLVGGGNVEFETTKKIALTSVGIDYGTLALGIDAGLLRMNSLSITTVDGGVLDLANNEVIINYGAGPDPISTIASYLVSGYASGAWNGPGINSSTAALPANSHYGIGYADGADGIVAGLSSGQIEVKYTLYGDANLDGVVNGSDFTILAGSLGKSVNGWDKGDFNYDGVVNATDFTMLIGNLGKSANGADVTLPASDYAAIDAFAEANGLMADVPEPASFGLLGLAAAGVLARRRRA